MNTKGPLSVSCAPLSACRAELMGLATLCIMLFHAYNFHFYNPVLDKFKEYGYLGVDVFIFLSGLGLAVSLLRRDGRPLREFLGTRIARIFPAYCLIAGCYSLWLVLQGRIPFSTLLWNLTGLHYWFQIPDSFNWYVSALLAFYLLAPGWMWLLRRAGHPMGLALLAFPVSYGIYRLSIVGGFLYTRDFVFRLPAFLVGMFIGYLLYYERPLPCPALWAGLAALAVGLTWGVRAGRLYVAPCFLFALAVFQLSLLLAWLLSYAGWFRKPLAALGRASLEIYLINVILTREYPNGYPHPARFYFAAYAVNLAAGLALHWAIGKAEAGIRKSAQKRNAGRA